MKKVVLNPRIVLADQLMTEDFQTKWIDIESLDNVGFILSYSDLTNNAGTWFAEIRMKDETAQVESELSALELSNSSGGGVTLSETAARSFGDFLYLQQLTPCQLRLRYAYLINISDTGDPNYAAPGGTVNIFMSGKGL